MMKPKPRVFIDMDGVIADFELMLHATGLTPHQLKKMPGMFKALKPIQGAIEGVRKLISSGFECWIASKPPTGIASAYSEKAEWIYEHLNELERRIILIHDKGLLGGPDDYLVDDRPHKAKCHQFPGTFIMFGDGKISDEDRKLFKRFYAAKSWEEICLIINSDVAARGEIIIS